MEVKPFGPVQLYETAGVVELPDNTTNGDEQVLTPPEAVHRIRDDQGIKAWFADEWILQIGHKIGWPRPGETYARSIGSAR